VRDPSATRSSAIVGLAYASIGALVGVWIAVAAIGKGYGVFAVFAPIAAFLSGFLTWWSLVARSRSYSWVRRACAGALAAVLGHYICCYLVMVSAFLSQALAFIPPIPGTSAPNPFESIFWAGPLALWSLVLVGWITVPIGAAIGGVMATRQWEPRVASSVDASHLDHASSASVNNADVDQAGRGDAGDA
jgi:hypothetical protein